MMADETTSNCTVKYKNKNNKLTDVVYYTLSSFKE